MSKTINNANGVKNSSNVAQMEVNVVNYIKAALAIDEPELKVTDIDNEYGLITITNDVWTVRMDYNGLLFEFKGNDDFLNADDLDTLETIRTNQKDIITAMFENVEAA